MAEATTASSGVPQLPPAIRGPAGQYVAVVREVFETNALALTFFGRATTARFDPAQQVARSVLVLANVDLAAIRRLAVEGPAFGRLGIAAPLIMTPEYIAESRDAFPLEFIEIQQQHVTAFGDDYFVELTFAEDHVRLHCERELKVLLIGMRQGLLASAGVDRLLSSLDADVGEGLLRALRGLLWLRGQRNAQDEGAVVAAVERMISGELHGLRRALSADARHGWEAYQELYDDVARIGRFVNDL